MRELASPRQASSLLMLLAAQPRPVTLMARMLGFMLVVVCGFLIWAPWQQVASAQGRVVAYAPADRQQVVDAPVDGRVVRLWAQEGQRVKQGDPLVDITDVDPMLMQRLQAERAAVEARQAAARSRMESDQARVEALEAGRRAAEEAAENRVDMAQERLRAAEHALEAAEAARATADLNLTRQKALLADGLTSKRALELAELEATRTRTEVDRAGATLNAAQSELLAQRNDATRIERDALGNVNSARASLASARSEMASAQGELARLEVRLSRQESQRVLSPRDGQILRVMAHQGGELVKQGDALMIIVPETLDRAVEVWVDGMDAPLVQPNREVRLQFEGWPAVQFTGWPSVAIGTFGGRVAFVDNQDDGKGRFRVLIVQDVTLDRWPDSNHLRQGVRANGFIFLNTVTVGFELWRQINGFPPAMSAPPPTDGSKAAKGGGK